MSVQTSRCPVCGLRVGVTKRGSLVAHYADKYAPEHCSGSRTRAFQEERSANTWHYLPVYVETDGERAYSLCEVYLDAEGRLTAWTMSREVAAGGADPEELLSDLNLMARDVLRWEPVEFSTLTAGMQFEPRAEAPNRKAAREEAQAKIGDVIAGRTNEMEG